MVRNVNVIAFSPDGRLVLAGAGKEEGPGEKNEKPGNHPLILWDRSFWELRAR